MLMKMLTDENRLLLIELARLLTLADKPLLWGEKTKEELTSDADLNQLTIRRSPLETELLKSMEQEYVKVRGGVFSQRIVEGGRAESDFTGTLKTFPLSRVDEPESRIQAATTVLNTLLENQGINDPATPKIIIFQLFLVALRDGKISGIEQTLLETVQHIFMIPDFIFKDLQARAEALNNEMSKTLALILE